MKTTPTFTTILLAGKQIRSMQRIGTFACFLYSCNQPRVVLRKETKAATEATLTPISSEHYGDLPDTALSFEQVPELLDTAAMHALLTCNNILTIFHADTLLDTIPIKWLHKPERYFAPGCEDSLL